MPARRPCIASGRARPLLPSPPVHGAPRPVVRFLFHAEIAPLVANERLDVYREIRIEQLPAKCRIAEIHEQHDALLVAEIPCLVLCRIAEDERLSRLPASRFLADAQRALVVHGESEVTAQHVLRPPVVTAMRLDVRTGREP